jgi:CHAD domain-containing protein
MSIAPLNYAFRSHEKIRDGIVRILAGISLRAANLSERSHGSVEVVVHEGRVLMKRLRALLWFARPVLTPSTHREAKACLRRASGLLAAQRDLAVTRGTLKKLAKKRSGKCDWFLVTEIIRKVAGDDGEASEKEQRRTLRKAMGIVRRTISDVTRNAKSRIAWAPPEKRMGKAFHAVKKAAKKARRTGSDTDFHTWRKKAKRLFYLLELTEPKPGRHRTRLLKRTDKLQDKLGEYHDAFMVEDRIRRKRLPPSAAKRVLHLLAKRKARLEKEARKRGENLWHGKAAPPEQWRLPSPCQ